MFKFTLTFLIVALTSISYGQGCVDPNRATPTFPCPDPSYKPVCGCDGVTYRNSCEAQYKYGVQFWGDGPCSGFEFDIIPNVVDDNNVMRVTFSQNAGITAQFVVIDFWGKQMHQQTLPASTNVSISHTFDFTQANYFRPGTYIILVYNASGAYRFKKFIKI